MSKNKTGGTVSSNMARYPDLDTYLQAKESKIYDIIESLGMTFQFKGGKKGNLTFLLPTNEKFIKELKALVEKDPEVASDYIYSLMIGLSLPTAGTWEDMKSKGITNKMGREVVFTELNRDKETIKLANGKSIKPHKKFSSFNRYRSFEPKIPPFVVWEYDGDEPIIGDKFPLRERRDHGEKSGKGEFFAGGSEYVAGGAGELKSEINNITNKLEKEYCANIHFTGDYNKNLAAVHGDGTFGQAVACLLEVIEKKDSKCLECISAVIGRCPVAAYYILVQPYSSSTSNVVSDSCLEEWTKEINTGNRNCDYNSTVNRILNKAKPLSGDNQSVAQKIKKCRVNATKRQNVAAVDKAIRTAYGNNGEGVLPGIYKSHIENWLNSHSGLKLWSDDIRFHTYRAMEAMCNEMFDREDIAKTMFERFRNYSSGNCMTDVNNNLLAHSNDNQVFYSKQFGFVNSDQFMWCPCNGVSGGYEGEAERNPMDNVNYDAMSMTFSGAYEKAYAGGRRNGNSSRKQGGVDHVVTKKDVADYLTENPDVLEELYKEIHNGEE